LTIADVVISLGIGIILMGVVYGLVRLGPRVLRLLAKRSDLRLPTQPVPRSWLATIERNVPLIRRLDAAERDRLPRLAQLLVSEVPFEGCDGLQVTEEMRVTIAATACLLLVNLPYPKFLALRRILIYPDTFVPVGAFSRHDRGIETDAEPTLGQAWRDGIVVLSWSSVLEGLEAARRSGNVVLHEFAHILDGEDGAFDGAPILDGGSSVHEWSRVLEVEFARQEEDIRAGRETPLDAYAATNRAEFFAVATETFFETPELLRTRLPELYAQLSRYYRQDPAAARAPA
jgi:MtfA peptidase